MLLFLQNWRSAIIPLVAVPVAIIGTFAVMAVFGFSLNNLTLFGLVLAIGIVVDDAIVVVEAVEHHIEHGLSPRDATIRAMEQVSGPVIAVGLVLTAVFVPCAFISGITGQFFRQFAMTIAVSTMISAFNSLTLSPALTRPAVAAARAKAAAPLPRLAFVAAGRLVRLVFLAPVLARIWRGGCTCCPLASPALVPTCAAGAAIAGARRRLGVGSLGALLNRAAARRFFSCSIAAFSLTTAATRGSVGGLLRVSVHVLLVYGGLLGLTYWRFSATPKGFIPSQDMGYLLSTCSCPTAASMERTQAMMDQIEQIATAHARRQASPGRSRASRSC